MQKQQAASIAGDESATAYGQAEPLTKGPQHKADDASDHAYERMRQQHGSSSSASSNNSTSNDSGSIGWAVLGFFCSFLGIILTIAWWKRKPKSAKMALAGVVASSALGILGVFLSTALSSVNRSATTEPSSIEQTSPANTSNKAVSESEGTWGTCTWKIDKDGLLLVSAGTGEDVYGEAPWHGRAADIIAVRFEEGVILPKWCGNLFADFVNMRTIELSGCDFSNVESLSRCFADCSSLQSIDVASWDTSHVTYFDSVFFNCAKLKEIDVSHWDTSHAENMLFTFYGCSAVTSLDVSNWDTSKVTDMYGTFEHCTSLKSLDASNWDTSQVETMADVFNSCSSLESLDISSWDTSRVKDDDIAMSHLFAQCTSLKRISVGEKFNMKTETSFPEATAKNKKWYSVPEKAWFTREEIIASRNPKACTYTNDEVTE